MVLPLKYSHLLENSRKYYIEKILSKNDKNAKINYFKNCIDPEKILPSKNWFQNFEKIWSPDEQSALKN